MRKLFYVFITILFFMSFNVHAESYDVKAKYEVTYNVEVFSGNIDNNSIEIAIDNYTFIFSSSLNNIEVVIIKTEGEVNDYAKSFSNSDENYYIAFFKNGEKITDDEIDIRIKNTDKVLIVYDNEGNVINKSSDYISLDSNDYFVTVTNKEYVFADVLSWVQDLEDINLNSDSLVEIYNHDNKKVGTANILGTNYRVRVINNNNISEYTIIVLGDVNSDGKISVLDIVKINNHIVDETKKLDSIYVLAGDYNGDNKLSVLDIVKINNAIIGGN